MLNVSNIKENRPLRVTFCAYRDWALKAVEAAITSCNLEVVDIIKSKEEYQDKVLSYPDRYLDCIVLVGWSWIIKDDILRRFLCVGMHPSDLPMYRGGSPIQHQIINGVEKTKISLMTISSDGVDVGDIWLKEEWDLSGRTMREILNALSLSTGLILRRFFDEFTDLKPVKQDLSSGSYYARRKPEESRMSWEDLSEMSLKDIYNLIRALGDPYPNLFIEDKEGNKLILKEADYIPKIEINDKNLVKGGGTIDDEGHHLPEDALAQVSYLFLHSYSILLYNAISRGVSGFVNYNSQNKFKLHT